MSVGVVGCCGSQCGTDRYIHVCMRVYSVVCTPSYVRSSVFLYVRVFVSEALGKMWMQIPEIPTVAMVVELVTMMLSSRVLGSQERGHHISR